MSQLAVPNVKRKGVKGTRSKGSMVINDSRQSQNDSGELKLVNRESDLIQSLQRGDEQAFSILIDRYYSSLLRVAMAFVPNRAVAEEVVQETWMGVLEGIGRFEGRSSLKTWLFRILTNRAKTRGIREKRYVAFADIGNQGIEEETPSENPEDYLTSGAKDSQWAMNSRDHDHMTPEKQALSNECLAEIAKAIETLPMIQQQVITLGDIEGSAGTDICKLLNISENNRRVILHRARSKVRQVLGEYLKENIDKPMPNTLESAGSLSFLKSSPILNRLSFQMVGAEHTTELNCS